MTEYTPEYTRRRHALEAAFIVAGIPCAIGLGYQIGRHLTGALDLLLVSLAAGLGYVAADFLAGLVHWAGDRFGSPETPLVGPGWIAPFREHHSEPEAMARRGFVELCGGSFLAVTPLLALCWLTPVPATFAPVLHAFVLSFGLFTGVTNQLHCWAHRACVPRWVAGLQRFGLILSPGAHALHHVPPFRGHYCVTSGWLNGPLARLRFFERLERLLPVRDASAGRVPRAVRRPLRGPGLEGPAGRAQGSP